VAIIGIRANVCTSIVDDMEIISRQTGKPDVPTGKRSVVAALKRPRPEGLVLDIEKGGHNGCVTHVENLTAPT